MMTEEQKQIRREQSFIAKEIARITDLPMHQCFGLAGKWRNLFGMDFCLEVLTMIPEGKTVPYITRMLDREGLKLLEDSGFYLNKSLKKWMLFDE